MPNIEIHGFHLESHLQRKIWELLEGAPYLDKVVVSYSDTHVVDAKGVSQPFLRIWATERPQRNDIVRRLEPLDIDIELPPLLDTFVPRISVQEAARAKLLRLRPVAGTDKEFDYPQPGAHSGT